MDLVIIESKFNGGDLFKLGRDLAVNYSFENMPYLALFGGNPGFPTPGGINNAEQNFDWWANSLLFSQDPGQQFNSLTEQRLMEVALNSSGRVQIEEAVKKDLAFMKEFADLQISVSIISDDKIRIDILIRKPDNLQDKRFIFIWDKLKADLVSEGIFSSAGLQETLQVNL